MSGGAWCDYDFAVVRVVPRVDLEAFENVGVVLHCRTEEFLDARIVADPRRLRTLVPGADHDLLARYLSNYLRVARGDPDAGPLALLPPSERFHWLTAPRSDVIQSSPVHGGRSQDVKGTLDALFDRYVEGPAQEG